MLSGEDKGSLLVKSNTQDNELTKTGASPFNNKTGASNFNNFYNYSMSWHLLLCGHAVVVEHQTCKVQSPHLPPIFQGWHACVHCSSRAFNYSNSFYLDDESLRFIHPPLLLTCGDLCKFFPFSEISIPLFELLYHYHWYPPNHCNYWSSHVYYTLTLC